MTMPSLNNYNQRLIHLITGKASGQLLSHISHQASLVIPCQSSRAANTANSITTTATNTASSVPPLHTFINLVVKRADVRPGTLVGVLVYLDRLQQRLARVAKGMPCSCQRIFLATLIVTTKILHDASPRNKLWAEYAFYFTLSEINLMERQLLSLMNYEFDITADDICRVFLRFENSIRRPAILPPALPEKKIQPKQKLKKTQQREFQTSVYRSSNPYSSSAIGLPITLALSASSSSSSLETTSSSSVASVSSLDMNVPLSGSLNHRIAMQNLKNATDAIVHNKWIDPPILYPAMPAHQNYV